MSELGFSGGGHGITPVTDPYTNKKYLPGTNMTVEWDPVLHGAGGSDVSAHYDRKRLTDHGSYTADQVGDLNRQLQWQAAFEANPEAFRSALEGPQEITPVAPQGRDPEYIKAVTGAMNQDPEGFWRTVAQNNPETLAGNLTPEQASGLWTNYADNWRQEDLSYLNPLFSTPEFANTLTQSVQKGSEGMSVDDFFWGIHSLFHHNPQGFQQWSQENPEMALRWHALAGTDRFETNAANWEGFDWNKQDHFDYANALAYQMSQDLGYGSDGKKDGRIVVGDYKSVDDVSNEGGWGDFWKVGTEQKLTDGLWNFIEENPVQTAAAVAALVAAPYTASVLGPAAGAGVTGAVTSGALSHAAGNDDWLQDALTSGVISATGGGLLEAAGPIMNLNDTPTVADAVRSGVQGTVLNLPGAVSDYNENQEVVWQPHDIPDELGQVQVQVPDYSIPSDDSGGGGGGNTGGGSPSSPSGGGQVAGGGEGGQPDGDERQWEYLGDGVFENQRTGERVTQDQTEGYVVGEVYSGSQGTTGEGAGDPGMEQPPTPNEDLPIGYEWVLVDGEWVLETPYGDQYAQEDVESAIYSDYYGIPTVPSGGDGSGSGSGSGTGTSEGPSGDGGTGGELGWGGPAVSPGSGGGTGGGTGTGDGSGEGDGEGWSPEETLPISGMLAGAVQDNDRLPLVGIPRVSRVKDVQLQWDAHNKLAELARL